jgi:hypothetical protein
LAFRNAAHRWVATHLANLIHVHGNEQDLTAQFGCSGCGFIASMTGADYYDIVIWIHVNGLRRKITSNKVGVEFSYWKLE